MKNIGVAIFLIIAGLIGLYVGGGLLFTPQQLQIGNGIELSSASHFSEARAPGAAIFTAAIFAILSVFIPHWRRTATIIMALFFTSYGLGRLLSLALDGMPSPALFYAMIGELVFGALAFIVLRYLNKTSAS